MKSSDGVRLAAALTAVTLVTVTLRYGLHVSNAAIVSTTYLMVVLVVATTARLAIAVTTSIAAMLCLNFFFLPPVGTFTIAEPQNWVALFAFLTVSLVASHLSAVARTRTEEALSRRNELARLFDLSREVLMMTQGHEALSMLSRSIARRFDLEFVAVAIPADGEWNIHEGGGRAIALDGNELTKAFAIAQTTLEFDARARTYAGHRTTVVEGEEIRLVPLRVGTKPIGILAAAGRSIEPGTLDTLAGVVAIAIERAQLLAERKAGELTRQSEQLKTALLASLAHDLRTPLTAIGVAATNIKAAALAPEDRLEQSEVILSEVERLTRLFHNLLEMARLDAGAVTTETRWTHPSEIIEAARDQVEHTLLEHPVRLSIEPDILVQLDPRLTASALAHLLENAAQYAPMGSTIDVNAVLAGTELLINVRDRGPGIPQADLPRVFERFYRGAVSRSRTSGTGMGLWIARGLLAVERGRVWAENCADGGARFTMAIPVEVKTLDVASAPA